MRRAIPRLALLLLSFALVPLAGHAAPQRVTAINGVGLIDYHDRPELKIGTWVKYHVTGSSALGMSDDYTVTVVMAGEERFWGDDGFWIETLTEHAGSAPVAMATLMSYSIFQDSLAFPHMQYYIRKTANEVDEQGNPINQVAKRPPETLINRNRKERDMHWYIDTLGTDSVHVTAGSFFCHKVRIRQAVGASVDQGDSTFYTEVREDRDSYITMRVPLTRIVREDIDYSIKRKSWLIGRSQDAPENVMEHSVGRAELIGYGTGYKPGMVPARFQHTLKEQDRRAAAPAAAPQRKPGGKSTRKSG
jgi:hypothetical protein